MDKKKIKTHFMTGKAYNGYVYASCFEYNGLYKINICTGEVYFVGVFPEEKTMRRSLYRDSILVDGKIFFMPDSAEKISVYDIDNDCFETISIPGERIGWCGYNGIEYEKKIILIPITLSKEVLVYDTKTSTFLKNECPSKIIDYLKKNSGGNVYRIGRFKSYVTIPISGENRYYVYDLKTGRGYEGKTESAILTVISDDFSSRLVTVKGMVRKLDEETLAYRVDNKKLIENTTIIMSNQEEVLLFNKEKVNVEVDNLCEKDINARDIVDKEKMEWCYTKSLLFFRNIKYQKTQIIISVNLDGIVTWDGENYTFKKFKGIEVCPEILLANISRELHEGRNILGEHETFGLESFVSLL